MLELLYIEIDVIGITFLLIMYHNLNKRRYDQPLIDEKIFKWLILCVTLISILDGSSIYLSGRTFFMAREINIVLTTIYFMLNPVCCFLWFMYNDYKLHEDWNRIIRGIYLYLIPVIINGVLSLTSQFTKWIFYIDEHNVYHRGNGYYIVPILCALYFSYSTYITIKESRKKSDKIKRELYFYLIIFPCLPFVGGVIQGIFYGVPLIWILVIISLFMIYINIQNRQIYRDNLTGLNNRLNLEQHINYKARFLSEDEMLFAIMVDVDKFKHINDTYGHAEGDRALIYISKILESSVDENGDFIARLGGDEFLIVGIRRDYESVYDVVETIRNNARLFNASGQCEYDISMSLGFAIWGEGIDTSDALINMADEMMYMEKGKKHYNIKTETGL